MINVNELKIFIDFVSNKEQSGMAYSITQLNNAFQAANIDLFKIRYGLPEHYVPGSPIPAQSYEVTQKIKDDLRVCKVVTDIQISALGEMILPLDYVHKTDITYKKIVNSKDCTIPESFYRPVEILDDDKYSERISSTIKHPTLDFPVCNFLSDRIRFQPKSLGSVEFSYLRMPSKPNWGYTLTNGIEQYDPNSSVDFDWVGILFTDIAKIVLSYLSINLRDGELSAAMDMYKTKGF